MFKFSKPGQPDLDSSEASEASDEEDAGGDAEAAGEARPAPSDWDSQLSASRSSLNSPSEEPPSSSAHSGPPPPCPPSAPPSNEIFQTRTPSPRLGRTASWTRRKR